MSEETTADAMFRFSVRWTGSNKPIASLLVPATKTAHLNSIKLQNQVAALVNVDPHSIKILLGSPAGLQLTPVLFTSAALVQDSQPHKAMVEAWSKLTADQVYNVFVTQHGAAALAVDKMVRPVISNAPIVDVLTYIELPLALRRNPVVALAAMDLSGIFYVRLPNELRNDKQFALAAVSRINGRNMMKHLDFALCDDEEVMLKAVEHVDEAMQHASPRLQKCKTFVLKAVSVNGLCIRDVAPELQSKKKVALAAVRQNAAAIDYLCNTLKADKDIQEACRTAQSDTDHS